VEKELIIDSKPTRVDIALLEDTRLVELHQQKTNNKFSVGDIFLGTVNATMPNLNAAFVNIGHNKDAFLHYTDLGPKLRNLLKWTAQARNGSINTHRLDQWQFEGDIIKTGKIHEVLDKKTPILVQVLKEPISTKGPRLSCEITIPGRFLVITPFNNYISISKKIGSKEERQRLKVLIESIKPRNFGVIVRTAAEGKKVADLHEEISSLLGKWEQIFNQLRSASPPAKLLSELTKTNSILRDMLTDHFHKIVTNDMSMRNNIKSYLGQIAPDKVDIVEGYKSKKPIFESYGVSRQIKSAFGKTFTMKSGAYLVIEHTEAMHVIDVNSGPKMIKKKQDEAVLSVNLESAREIARQLRLRDIGGLIIIDFIDMKNPEHRSELYKEMKNSMASDRAQHTILPLSKFGLMQITRQRVRPAVKISTSEKCPSCNGTGKISATILVTDSIERDIGFVYSQRPRVKLRLRTHPFIAAYFKKDWRKKQRMWYKKYRRWIHVIEDSNLGLTQYVFSDDKDDEIRLN